MSWAPCPSLPTEAVTSSFLLGLHQSFLHEAAVQFLDVGVDALGVGHSQPHHVIHVQQLSTVSQFPKEWGRMRSRRSKVKDKGMGAGSPATMKLIGWAGMLELGDHLSQSSHYIDEITEATAELRQTQARCRGFL